MVVVVVVAGTHWGMLVVVAVVVRVHRGRPGAVVVMLLLGMLSTELYAMASY